MGSLKRSSPNNVNKKRKRLSSSGSISETEIEDMVERKVNEKIKNERASQQSPREQMPQQSFPQWNQQQQTFPQQAISPQVVQPQSYQNYPNYQLNNQQWYPQSQEVTMQQQLY